MTPVVRKPPIASLAAVSRACAGAAGLGRAEPQPGDPTRRASVNHPQIDELDAAICERELKRPAERVIGRGLGDM